LAGQNLRLAGPRQMTKDEFGALFEQSSPKLWCIAAAVMGDRSRATDVVQEAAVVALGKLDEFDPATSFAAWMGQIVRFIALNHARKRGRDTPGLTDPATMDTSHPTSDRPARNPVDSAGHLMTDQTAFDDDVQRALRALEETARSCLLLKIVADLSYAEIARTLGIPEGTAMSHVHRARKAMRERLGSVSGGPARSGDTSRAVRS
jgi:RNA polymerase sigma-70 factor (ECF subfamily)